MSNLSPQQKFERAREQLILLARQCVAEGLVGPREPGGALRFQISSEADLERACSIVKERMKEGKEMSNRHDTAEGRAALQQVHDICSRFGAICTAPGKLSEGDFVSKHESTKLQAIHNLAVEGGAKCRAVGDGVFSEEENFGLHDPRQLARQYVQARNEKRPVALRSAPTSEEMEAVREGVRRHVERRNSQIKAQKERTQEIEESGGIAWGR